MRSKFNYSYNFEFCPRLLFLQFICFCVWSINTVLSSNADVLIKCLSSMFSNPTLTCFLVEVPKVWMIPDPVTWNYGKYPKCTWFMEKQNRDNFNKEVKPGSKCYFIFTYFWIFTIRFEVNRPSVWHFMFSWLEVRSCFMFAVAVGVRAFTVLQGPCVFLPCCIWVSLETHL